MPERSKGADLRSAGLLSAWVRTPLQAHVPVAKWIRRRFPEPKIVGSSPIWDASYVFFFFCRGHLRPLLRPFCAEPRRNHDSSSLEAEHRSYESGVAGSIPARSILSACSVMVIIDASQALDPGSIPGRRTRTFNYQNDFVLLG